MARVLVNVVVFSATAIFLLWGGQVVVYGQQARIRPATTSIEKTIGVLSLNSTVHQKNSQLRFLNKDGSLWYQFSFYGDVGIPSSTRADFKPFVFHPDYFLLVVKCVRRHVDRWEVLVNEATGLTKFVRVEDRSLKFETWGDHVLKVFAVDFDQAVNPVRTGPSNRRNSIQLADKMIYQPVQVRGYWLKIRAQSPENERLRSRIRTGWIKWRDAKALLIELFYFG